MEVTKTNITGVFVIEPKIFKDQRGYFFESYNKLYIYLLNYLIYLSMLHIYFYCFCFID